MGSFSVEIQDIERYRQQFSKDLEKAANKVFLYNNYAIGERTNIAEINHILIFERMMCESNCEIINFINKKITDNLPEKHKKKSLCKKIQEYKRCKDYDKYGDYGESQMFNDCCNIDYKADW